MESVFKIGQLVRVKKITKNRRNYLFGYGKEIEKYAGQIFIISGISTMKYDPYFYETIFGDKRRYMLKHIEHLWFCSEMLEPVNNSGFVDIQKYV